MQEQLREQEAVTAAAKESASAMEAAKQGLTAQVQALDAELAVAKVDMVLCTCGCNTIQSLALLALSLTSLSSHFTFLPQPGSSGAAPAPTPSCQSRLLLHTYTLTLSSLPPPWALQQYPTAQLGTYHQQSQAAL